MNRFKESPTEHRAVKAFAEAWNDAERPALYATLKRDFAGRDKQSNINVLLAGQRVRVQMIPGNVGDYGVTTVLDKPTHYEARATLAEVTDYSDKP